MADTSKSHDAATNTGYRSAATNTGDQSASQVDGAASVAMAVGVRGRARAASGSAIVLCYRDDDGSIIHIRASQVGENGVKPDTWYSLDAAGKFVEAD